MEKADDNDITIISHSKCSSCNKLKQTVAKDRIKFLDIDQSDEAVKLAIDHDIKEVPTVIKGRGREAKKCKLGYAQDGDLIADCGIEKVNLSERR